MKHLDLLCDLLFYLYCKKKFISPRIKKPTRLKEFFKNRQKKSTVVTASIKQYINKSNIQFNKVCKENRLTTNIARILQMIHHKHGRK